MADNNQAHDTQDILEDGQAHDKKAEAMELAKLLSTLKSKQEWQTVQAVLDSFMDRPEDPQAQERESEFWQSTTPELIKTVFELDDFTPDSPGAKQYIAMLYGITSVTFPELRAHAPEGATFAEATGLDPEYIKSRRVLIFQESLWNELYPPAAAAPTEPDEPAAALDHVTVKRAGAVEYPLDKVNLNIWQFVEETSGQLKFAMEAKRGPQNTRKQIDCIYSIDFSALEEEGVKTTRRLTSFDKRVYIAASALFNAGNDVISLRQIFYAMGQKGSNPTVAQLERINESITKMARAWVTVDDSQEHNAYNYNLDEGDIKNGWRRGKYEGSLLPLERVSIKANGKTTDAALHLFREPPVITFAKMRNQITTVDLKLLQSPASKTDMNLAIEDYLISRLSRAKKSGKESEKILFKTLFEKTGITEKKQRARTPDKIKTYLDYYKEAGDMLKSYLLEKESVTVYF